MVLHPPSRIVFGSGADLESGSGDAVARLWNGRFMALREGFAFLKVRDLQCMHMFSFGGVMGFCVWGSPERSCCRKRGDCESLRCRLGGGYRCPGTGPRVGMDGT